MGSAIAGPPIEDLLDGSFITRDGLTLSSYRFDGPVRGVPAVVLVHGLADHSRSLPYLKVGRYLRDRGFAVYAFDRRGSGRSQGLANFAQSWGELREDLSRFVDLVEDQTGRLPFLIGLSFGGLQVIDFTIENPDSVPGVVGLAPALDSSGTSASLRRVIPLLARIVPRMPVDPRLDDSAITRDPEVLKLYRNDPLWKSRTTPVFAQASLEAIDRVHARAPRLRKPILLIHGTADRVVPIHGTRLAFPRFGVEDKTFLEIPGAFHALPIEPEGDAICGHIADWLNLRSRPA